MFSPGYRCIVLGKYMGTGPILALHSRPMPSVPPVQKPGTTLACSSRWRPALIIEVQAAFRDTMVIQICSFRAPRKAAR